VIVKTFDLHVRLEVLTAVVMGRSVFWDMMPCSPLNFCLLPVSYWVLAWLILLILRP
jgi:hypothetical protein